MAAYAALLSLMTTLNNIQIHPRVSTFFDRRQIQSLHHIIDFLLQFVETSDSHGGRKEVLERRIASMAHRAEDVIESHVVGHILADEDNLIGRHVTFCASPTRYNFTCLDLEIQIQHMNSVKETVMEFQRIMKFQHQQSSSPASSKPLTTTKKNLLVGFDQKLIQIMDRLTGHQPHLQVVPIVGMGGIGKTTLAKSTYDNLLIVESFDIRAWVTISQQYSVTSVLSELLSCIIDKKVNPSIGAVDCDTGLETGDHQLGVKLYQTLWGRRYLIVLDDIWSLEAWDMITCFFPDNGNRSRVVITSRILSVATHLSSSPFEMNFLDENQSWELFCGNVFLEKGCPPELEPIGKEITRKCKGLPLSIVVIGGLLRNSQSTRECWEKFTRDLNSMLVSENDEHCLNILCLSYNHLPLHLKLCFLYMGVFHEDEKIRVSKFVKLFVAEGFLKSKEGQTFEDVTEDYLSDLVDRNLILVDSWRWSGRIKSFKMHDLVREVCLKIGVREKIFHRTTKLDSSSLNWERRIVFDRRCDDYTFRPFSRPILQSARTFLSDEGPLLLNFRLVRVLACVRFESFLDIYRHVNLRYLNWSFPYSFFAFRFSSSVSQLWNVHTLIFKERLDAPPEIWYMRQLRHLQFGPIFLPDPTEEVEQQDDALLPNLHTLSTVMNFSLTEQVCKKIPNIRKLHIAYTSGKECYYNLDHLHKLESFFCTFSLPKRDDLLLSLVFPSSLRKLSLNNCGLHWEDLNTFGLSLPSLEVLKLYMVNGRQWDCVEGAFPRLKFLQIDSTDLIKWNAENSNFFPVLEKLHLFFLTELEKIPSGIGEIQTLGSLHMHYCSLSAAISATEILEEQLSLGYEDLQVVVRSTPEMEKSFMEMVGITSFTTKNLQVGSLEGFLLSLKRSKVSTYL